MTLEVKHTYPRYLTGIFFACFLLALTSCDSKSNKLHEIQGQAQGTYYSIKYISDIPLIDKQEIDFVFDQIDSSLSTYKPYSLINALNKVDSVFIKDPLMIEMLIESNRVFKQTKGAFDPTVMPLVRAWGFGPEGNKFVSDIPIDSILSKVGWNKLAIKKHDNGYLLVKGVKDMQLDFNAIAQGYTSDVLADYLEQKGISDYLIDSGGELRAKGKNQKEEYWAIGIERPEEDNMDRSILARLELRNKSVATSGNYRKFYIKDGIKYSHTISPFTGMPAEHTLLSATVITDSCSMADAYATALMVLGTEKAIQFVENQDNIEAYLVFSDENGNFKTYQSKGLAGKIEERD